MHWLCAGERMLVQGLLGGMAQARGADGPIGMRHEIADMVAPG